LPQAIAKAKPILAKFNMGDRIRHRPGDALKEDLGENLYDIILVSSLMHHFTSEQNQELSKRAARALKPGGVYVIQEFIRPPEGKKMEMLGALSSLFFNLSSTSGNWSVDELKAFQTNAGLQFVETNNFITLPGYLQVCARKK
jgi:SAM-dependent methyltransferase